MNFCGPAKDSFSIWNSSLLFELDLDFDFDFDFERSDFIGNLADYRGSESLSIIALATEKTPPFLSVSFLRYYLDSSRRSEFFFFYCAVRLASFEIAPLLFFSKDILDRSENEPEPMLLLCTGGSKRLFASLDFIPEKKFHSYPELSLCMLESQSDMNVFFF